MTFVSVSPYEALDTFVRLITAFILGSVIGFERQHRHSTAGLRPVASYINSLPFTNDSPKLSNIIHITTFKNNIKEAISFLEQAKQSGAHPLSDFHIKSFSEKEVKIDLILTSTVQNYKNINDFIFYLSSEPSIDQVVIA